MIYPWTNDPEENRVQVEEARAESIDPRIFDPECPTCQSYRRTYTPCNHMHHVGEQ